MSEEKKIGVIGAGRFGTALANLLAENFPVLIYARKPEVVANLNKSHRNEKLDVNEKVRATNELEEVAKSCTLIYPVVPSAEFRGMIKDLAPHLKPDHLLIHATKGFDVPNDFAKEDFELSRDKVKTMSEVIREESVAVRIGCLAGPNLAGEISEGQPAATVIASRFDEVIKVGQQSLRSSDFQVYGSPDLLGIELAGVLKNYIAIVSGALTGLGYGDNARALLVTRGMAEMIYIGRALGAHTKAFLGLAGIGDLMATCSSHLSRNFKVGFKLAKGEKLEAILSQSTEVAEGVNTVKITKALSDFYQVRAPIVQALYKIMFEEMPLDRGLKFLMKYPAYTDAEYIDT